MSKTSENKTIAVLDVGSNTFHLLIVQLQENGFKEIYRERKFVGLSEGGGSYIKPSAIERASKAFQAYAKVINKYEPNELKIIGTAMLRMAKNSDIIKKIIYDTLDTSLEIIDGNREADLIYKGVSLLTDLSRGNHVIMDIGGGSVEYILVQNGKPTWLKSFDIGVSILHRKFHKSEPISHKDISKLNQFLKQQLLPLKKAIGNEKIDSIIGASGSFEVILFIKKKTFYRDKLSTVELKDFHSIKDLVVLGDYEQRATLEQMPESRVKFIVVAFLLLEYSLKLITPSCISMSPYALKEGVINEYLH